jgi:DNA-binding SARP family transcriptional activator/WD40 repeat protein
VRFGVLGTLVVESGEPPVELPVAGAKERVLLGRLLVSPGHVVQVDTLVEDVWDADPPPTARKSLQAHVVRLRTSLEPDRPKGSPGTLVVRRGDGYALAVAPEDVDAEAAAAKAAVGRATLAEGQAARARELLREAEHLWRGEPFVDWPDASWAQGARRSLTTLRDSVLEARLDADLALGRHREVVAELERLVDAEPLNEGWWTRLMVALYRSDRQADALATGRRARALLAEELGLDAGPGLRRVELAILDQAEELGGVAHAYPLRPVPLSGEPGGRCPYQGLATYEASNADVFCGRGSVVRALVSRVAAAGLVVVSGASGAGKSSLARAGLLPALAQGRVPGSERWRSVVIAPGGRPVDELGPLLTAAADGVRDPVVLVVDQFEELWTAGAPEGERRAFMDELLAMLDDGVAARVVVVVRGDHLGRLGEHPGMAERTSDGIVLVAPMTETELREVVEGPAAVAGLTVDPDLLDAVVRDVQNQPGALPLLSMALVGTWERRRGAVLTLAAYLETGGVTAAVARTAEAALAALDDEGRVLARRLLVRLASTGEAGAAVRRRVPVLELGFGGADGPARRAVVEAFVSRRLLTIDGQHVEVTHEALLTAWPRLAGWLAEDAVSRAVRTHLAPEAREWVASGRPGDRLYRGARLDAAQEWLQGPDADPTDTERDFVEASTTLSQAELAESRAQTLRERAGRRRTRRLATVLAAAMVAALGAGGFAVQRQREAVRNAVTADANRLAAASVKAPALDLSLLLAVQAYRTKATPLTEDGLLAAVVKNRQVAGIYRADDVARQLAVSPDGTTLFAHAHEQVVAWDLATRSRRPVYEYRSAEETPIDLDVADVPGQPSRPLVAVVASRGAGGRTSSTVSVLGSDGEVIWTLSETELGGWPVSAEFTADATQLAVEVFPDYAIDDASVQDYLIDIATRQVRPVGPSVVLPGGYLIADWVPGFADGAATAITSMEVETPDGPDQRAGVLDVASQAVSWLEHADHNAIGSAFVPVTGGVVEMAQNGAMYWYPGGSARWTQQLSDHTSQVKAAATDATGTVLVTGGTDGRVVVHRRSAEGTWTSSDVLTGHQGNVVALAVSADGDRAFSAGDDQTVIEWDLSDDARFGTLIPRIRDPDDAVARPLVTGTPAVVDDGRVWVFPMIEGVSRAGSTARRTKSRMVAGFMDTTSLEMVGFVPFDEALELSWIPPAAAAASGDGRFVAVTAEFSTRILDTRDRRVVATVRLDPVAGASVQGGAAVPERAAAVAWSRDGTRLFIGTGDEPLAGRDQPGALVVVDTATWRVERRILPDGIVTSLSVSPDGALLAVGYAQGQVLVVDAHTYAVVHALTASSRVSGVAFSPNGSRLATIGGKRLDLWDVASGRPLYDRASDVAGGGIGVEWLTDDRLAYGRLDGQIETFDVPSRRVRGAPLPVFRDGGGGLVFLGPTAADTVAALPGARAGGALREGMSYPLDPLEWLTHACRLVSRDLTADERKTYLPGRPPGVTCPDRARTTS